MPRRPIIVALRLTSRCQNLAEYMVMDGWRCKKHLNGKIIDCRMHREYLGTQIGTCDYGLKFVRCFHCGAEAYYGRMNHFRKPIPFCDDCL